MTAGRARARTGVTKRDDLQRYTRNYNYYYNNNNTRVFITICLPYQARRGEYYSITTRRRGVYSSTPRAMYRRRACRHRAGGVAGAGREPMTGLPPASFPVCTRARAKHVRDDGGRKI